MAITSLRRYATEAAASFPSTVIISDLAMDPPSDSREHCRGVSPCAAANQAVRAEAGLLVFPELEAGDHGAVDLVGTVGEAEGTGHPHEARQLGIGHDFGAVDQNRRVHQRLHH